MFPLLFSLLRLLVVLPGRVREIALEPGPPSTVRGLQAAVPAAAAAKHGSFVLGMAVRTWKAFLNNHVNELVSIDFFTVPTATFRVLFVLVVLAHRRRRVVHFNVTGYPTAAWTAQQILEAFPEDTAPRYLIRDRDRIYG